MVARSEVVLIQTHASQGTGFLVAPDLLVTALHVVAEFDAVGRAVVDEDGLPHSHGAVTCTYYSELLGFWSEITKFDPKHDAHNPLEDWAVLRVQQAEGGRIWATERARKDRHDQAKCSAYGFPATHRDKGTVYSGKLTGIRDPSDAATTSDIGSILIHRACFREAIGWGAQTPKGFSGGPVVVADRAVGIVRRFHNAGGDVPVGATVDVTPIEVIYAATGVAAQPRDPTAVSDAPPTVEIAAPPKYVFAVYFPTDQLLVARLCRELINRGVRTWLDVWDLAPGIDRQAELRAALIDAPAVIVCDGPGGSGARAPTYDEALRARIDRDPSSVVHVGLPGAPGASEGHERIDLGADWGTGVASLAGRLGIDDDRSSWLSFEVESTGVAASELSPYRGLAAFREVDARWMFGRDEEIGNLLALAEKQALLTVIGASGSGKSSLVMAGLCPALRNGALRGERVEAIAYLRPGKSPCEELARALVSFSPTEDPVTRAKKVADLRDDLRESTDRLRLVVREIVSGPDGRPVRKVLLVVDQLEELFTEARLGQKDESPEAMPFVRNIIEATKDGDTPLWIVSTLRADFLPSCLAVAELARTLKSGTYFALPPMREDQLYEAIELPARRVGFEIEPKLVEKLVAGAADQAGRLPLLEHVLRELWQRRDESGRSVPFAAYEGAGGLEGAIAKAADRALSGLRERLGERALTVTRRLMTRLVHIGQATQGDTRRRATLDDLGRDEETRQVLDAFVRDARVLVSDGAGGVEVIEIAHEALLREWQTLVGWLDADRGALRLRQDLAEDAVAFEKRRDAEFLWGKGRIDEARRVLAASMVKLNDQERRFLEASVRAARARSFGLWSSVAVVLVVLLGALAFITNLNAKNEQQAQANARQAHEYAELAKSHGEARRRSDEAAASQKGLRATMLISNGSYIEAAVLAIEAVGFGINEMTPPAPAYDGLMAVLAADPAFKLAELEGQGSTFGNAAVSPDGSLFAAVGVDGAIRLWNIESGEAIRTFRGDVMPATDVVFSPDGSLLATTGWDGTARLWDIASGELRETLYHSAPVGEVAFSPDGSTLATSCRNTAYLWNIASGDLREMLVGHSDLVSTVAFSPNGPWLATASLDSTVRLWHLESGTHLFTLRGHSNSVVRVAFSPDGARLATASWDGTARLWDVASGGDLLTFSGHSDRVFGVAFSPDGTRLATSSLDGTARLWETASGKPLITLQGHSDGVVAAAFSPDGARLATSGLEGTARLWDVQTGRPLALLQGFFGASIRFSPDGTRLVGQADLWDVAPTIPLPTFRGHSDILTDLAFSADGARVITTSRDTTTRLWDVGSGKPLATLNGHYVLGETAWPEQLTLSPDGTRLATMDHSAARLWDVKTGKLLATLDGHSGILEAMAFSPGGDFIATVGSDETARLWDVMSGKLRFILEGHSMVVDQIAFSPNGSRLVTGGFDGTVRLWDVASGKSLAVLEGHSGFVTAVAFSPDGVRLATGGNDKTARLWPAGYKLEGHSEAVNVVAFSPDGTRLATAGFDETPLLWEVASGERVAPLKGHSAGINDVVFSSDGARIATASADATARLWNAASGEHLATFSGHSRPVVTVAFSPNGTRLATASSDETARLWPTTSYLAMELACRRIHDALQYYEVAQICDPILASTD